MLRSIGLPELLVVMLVSGVFLIPAAILFLFSLQRALRRCSPASRTMPPGQVWLLLIPVFNVAWQFVVVLNLSKSLHNEFVLRNLPNVEPEPAKTIGLAMSILGAVSMIPLIGLLAWIPSVVCWIIYWVKISQHSNLLESPFAPTA